METLKIVYVFKPVDVTYVIAERCSDDKILDIFCWNSEADLNTTDEQIAFAKTKVDAGIEVEIGINGKGIFDNINPGRFSIIRISSR